ncbi:hypothetical protein [Lentibacillus juripiscarius]|uniref:YpzG family protein n=1 Tax=Lentibacillus juripiscarius TaxID=257446 RepID=A0ABW5V279_9BACI
MEQESTGVGKYQPLWGKNQPEDSDNQRLAAQVIPKEETSSHRQQLSTAQSI